VLGFTVAFRIWAMLLHMLRCVRANLARNHKKVKMTRSARWYDPLVVNALWFGLTVRAQTLGGVVVPLLVQRFVGEAQKGQYFGTIRLWALMTAVLAQAAMGALSDRSRSRWGRRKPFVAFGTAGELVVLALLVAATRLEGVYGYWVLLALYVASAIASNSAQAAGQALIPDLAPTEKRGLYSGIKALLEVPLPLFFVSAVVGPLVGAGKMQAGLLAVMGVLAGCAVLTMLVGEDRSLEASSTAECGELGRLVLMTLVFTSVIVGLGRVVRLVLSWSAGLDSSQAALVAILAGVGGMLAAVVGGVLVCVRVAVGRSAEGTGPFAWWVVNRLAFLVAANGLSGFMLYFLQERFVGLEAERAAGPASSAVLLVGAFILVTAVPSGWIADRVGKRSLVALSGLVATAGMSVLLLVPTMAAVYAGGSLIGLAVGVFFTVNWALGTELVPKGQAGRYLGLANLAGAGAGAIGAYIGGPIADQNSYLLVYGIYASLFFASVLALGAACTGPSPAHTGM
jgi:MFS family permease